MKKRFTMSRLACAASLLVLPSACGCGKGGVGVQGEVTYAGEPALSGTIVFEPADGQGPTAGGTIENGRYTITKEAGVTPGEKKVRVVLTRTTGRKIPAGQPPGAMVDEIERIEAPPQAVTIEPGETNQIPLHLQPN